MKKILAAAFHQGGGQAILPVVKLLKTQADVTAVVQGPSQRVFSSSHQPYRTLDDYGIAEITLPSAYSIIAQEEPSLILTGTSSQDKDTPLALEQALTAVGKEKGIPTIAVLDFWGNYKRRFSDLPEGTNLAYLPDKICVPDLLALRDMVDQGFQRSQLAVTGNPHFDSRAAMRESWTPERGSTIRYALDLEQDRFTILYASQPIEFHYQHSLGYTEKTALEELLYATAHVHTTPGEGKPQIIVRPHPAEDPSVVQSLLHRYHVLARIDNEYPAHEVILASDVVVSPFSTLLVEAVILGIPGISLQPGLQQEDLLTTNRYRITTPVYSKGEMIFILDKLMHDLQYRGRLLDKAARVQPDGHAADKIADLAMSMAK
jgi:hypothetical protein